MEMGVPLFYSLVARVRVDVNFSKAISDFTEPGLSANELGRNIVVSDDVHITPPSVKQVMVPLVVHTHFNEVHGGKVAGNSRASHLSVVHDSHVGGAHGIEVLFVNVRDKNDLSSPSIFSHVVTDIFLSFTSSLETDNSDEIVNRAGFSAKTSRGGVFQKEFLNTFSYVFNTEFGFDNLVSRSEENDLSSVRDSVVFSEVSSDILNSFLEISGEVALTDHQRLFLKEVGKSSILRINVLNSFINTILSNKFRRELEAILSVSLEGHCVMHVVNVLLGPLTEITHKSVEVMTLGHVNVTVAVEMTHLVHEHECHVLVVDVKNQVGPTLENFLR